MPVLFLTAAMAVPLSAGHTVSFLRKHSLIPVSKGLVRQFFVLEEGMC